MLKRQSSFYSLIAKNPTESSKARELLKPSEIKINPSAPHFIESKYSLKTANADLYYLDLTEEQAIALNSWSYFGGKMPEVLTSDQQERRLRLKAKLTQKDLSSLRPARAGKELQVYREKLRRWLDE